MSALTSESVEHLSVEELNTRYIFLKGRMKVGVFLSHKLREETYDDFALVESELKRRERESEED